MESSFVWLSEYGEVKDKSKWNPVGNLNATSWKPLAIHVISCITSDISSSKPQTAISMKLLLALPAFPFVYVKWVTYLAFSLISKEVSVLFNGIVNTQSEEQAAWKWSLTGFFFLSSWQEDKIIAPGWQGRAQLKERGKEMFPGDVF